MRSKWIDVLLVIIVCGFVAFLVWKYKHPGPIIGDERGGAASAPMMAPTMAPSQPTSTPMMATDTAATGTTGTMMMSKEIPPPSAGMIGHANPKAHYKMKSEHHEPIKAREYDSMPSEPIKPASTSPPSPQPPL